MRLGTYTDTLEIENEMLRKQVKDLKAQLQPYLDAEAKRIEFLMNTDKVDKALAKMQQILYSK
jgi:cell division protein FtsB